MPLTTIDSLQNQRIKRAKALTQKRQRDRAGLFLLEGEREVRRGLEAGIEATQFMLCPELFKHGEISENLHEELIAGDIPVIYLTSHVFKHCSYRDNPDGFLAVCRTFKLSLEDTKLSDNALLLILESVEKPGNLGTILRTADATGVDALIINDPVTDLFNPNVIRASAGVAFNVPAIVASSEETRSFLKSHRIQSIATTPDTSTLYHDVPMRQSSAILMGSEKDGLSKFWLKEADIKARLPMSGQADSLNVSVTTAIMLYEAIRQRSTL